MKLDPPYPPLKPLYPFDGYKTDYEGLGAPPIYKKLFDPLPVKVDWLFIGGKSSSSSSTTTSLF